MIKPKLETKAQRKFWATVYKVAKEVQDRKDYPECTKFLKVRYSTS